MISEIDVFSKDFVRMNILDVVLSGTAEMNMELNNDGSKSYANDIHNERSRVQVFGRFNLSEDLNNNIIAIRPVVVEASLRIRFLIKENIADRTIAIIRSGTKVQEQAFPINKSLTSISFIPIGKQKYTLQVEYDDSVVVTETPTSVPSRKEQNRTPSRVPRVQPKEQKQSPPIQSEPVDTFVPASGSSGFEFESFDFDSRFDLGQNSQVNDTRFSNDSMDFGFGNDSVPKTDISQDTHQASPASTTPRYESTPSYSAPVNVASAPAESDARVEQEIQTVEYKRAELNTRRQSAINHLEKIEAEYRKDYDALSVELEEIKGRMEADSDIIEYYKDRDIIPVETLLQEARLKLEEAETQIAMFIRAKQQKTMEIEGEVKANKK